MLRVVRAILNKMLNAGNSKRWRINSSIAILISSGKSSQVRWQGTKSDRELHVRGDPWAVSVRRVRPRLTELFSKIATQASKLFEKWATPHPCEGGEGRVGGSASTGYFRLETVG